MLNSLEVTPPGIHAQLILLILTSVLSFCLNTAHAEEANEGNAWKVWRQTGELSVSYRPSEFNELIEIKARVKVKSTLSGFMLFILDTKNVANWLDNAKSTEVIKQLSPTENIFITTFNRFGPIRARDMVIQSRYWQNPDLSMEIHNLDAAGAVPLQPNTIRLNLKKARWLLIPNGDKSITITYTFTADAKGKIPSWLAEPMALNGIWKTMTNIRQQLPVSAWQDHTLPMIEELW